MLGLNLFGRFSKFYCYSCIKLTFLVPSAWKSSLRPLVTKKSHAISSGRIKPVTKKLNSLEDVYDNKRLNPPLHEMKLNEKMYASKNVYPRAKGVNKMTKSRDITVFQGLQEFFTHPMTWDRNNGYLNILLGLAIFGYSFCTSCTADLESTPKVSLNEKQT